MRLLVAESIRTSRLECVDFNPNEIEPYAILSHTWTKDEVLLADVVNGTAADRGAYEKVRFACEQAISDGFGYVWIDTCCIDKTSSAELSEAINSMFAWYRGAAVCYAYLSDLGSRREGGVQSLAKCRWFTRGFTLQELIAPAHVVFYKGDEWIPIGDKTSLSKKLAQITKISEEILTGTRPFETASVANRMGWACKRRTTRPEDIAYCLMGIFNVNMPLLYGEGTKAFFRLQEEIMKQTTDHSLFAWIDKDAPDDREYELLAPSPSCFEKTAGIVPYQQWETRLPHSITNEGLSIHLPIVRVTDATLDISDKDSRGRNVFWAALDCPAPDYRNAFFTAVLVVETASDKMHYARIRANVIGGISRDFERTGADSKRRQFYVSPSPAAPGFEVVYPWHFMNFVAGPSAATYRIQLAARFVYSRDGEISESRGYSPIMDEPHMDEQRDSLISENLGRMAVNRGHSKLTLVLLLERKSDGRRLIVAIGTVDPLHLGVCAYEIESRDPIAFGSRLVSLPPLAELQQRFKPVDINQRVLLANHSVSVVSKSKVTKMTKEYYLTLNVTPAALDSWMPSGSVHTEGPESSGARGLGSRTISRLRNMVSSG
jgi:hypothetical protein